MYKVVFFKNNTICSNVYEAAAPNRKTYCKFTDFVHMEEDLKSIKIILISDKNSIVTGTWIYNETHKIKTLKHLPLPAETVITVEPPLKWHSFLRILSRAKIFHSKLYFKYFTKNLSGLLSLGISNKACSHLTSASPSEFNVLSIATQTLMQRMGLDPLSAFASPSMQW